MKLTFESDSIFIAILNVIVNGIRFWTKNKMGIDIPDTIIWKMYYEIQKFAERNKLNRVLENIDEEQFINFLKEFIDVVDKEDPAILQRQRILWEIFVILKDYLNKDWIKNNPFMESLKSAANKKIIMTPELLDYKVKRDVDYAIQDYENQVPVNLNETEPVYSEKEPDESVAQTLLGGEMRLTAPWAVQKSDSDSSESV